jgi:uncharacterized SAM-binding protein YcdF (DUF218 family)
VAALPGVAALAWLGGFLWFVHLASVPARHTPTADGIVVLTGGADRVESGLRLLADGYARLLLVSGAARGAELPDLARVVGFDAAPLAGRITVGHSAVSTRGNAAETADWVHRNALHSLVVVTASYHMPRALAELSAAMPDIQLYPAPVQPPAMRGGGGGRLSTLRLLASEYTKWLAVELGVDHLVPLREQQQAATERHRG